MENISQIRAFLSIAPSTSEPEGLCWHIYACTPKSIPGRTASILKLLNRIQDPFILKNYTVRFNNMRESGHFYEVMVFEPVYKGACYPRFQVKLNCPHHKKWAISGGWDGFRSSMEFSRVSLMADYINSTVSSLVDPFRR